MFNEDSNGFVKFPYKDVAKENGKTLIYLVAFEPINISSLLSNVNITLSGFYSDDVVSRPKIDLNQEIDDFIDSQLNHNDYDRIYFPDMNIDDYTDIKSIDLISSVCIGWDNYTYNCGDRMWVCRFKDLTNQGQKLYFSLKKLHNNKEIRILTFNSI